MNVDIVEGDKRHCIAYISPGSSIREYRGFG